MIKLLAVSLRIFAQWLHVECLSFVASIKGNKLLFIICLLSSARERASGSAPRVFFCTRIEQFVFAEKVAFFVMLLGLLPGWSFMVRSNQHFI